MQSQILVLYFGCFLEVAVGQTGCTVLKYLKAYFKCERAL